MALELAAQDLSNNITKLRDLLTEARDFLDDTRTYALNLKNLVAAGEVYVQNFPATMPVSGSVNIGNLPNPLPVSIPGLANPLPVRDLVVGTPAAVSLTATGDVVAAQGAGVAIRLLAAIVGATSAVTLSLRNGAADVIPIRLGANGSAVLPYLAGGWMTTNANTALRCAFAGSNTVTVYALWTAA